MDSTMLAYIAGFLEISDYNIVESKEVEKILKLLQPYKVVSKSLPL